MSIDYCIVMFCRVVFMEFNIVLISVDIVYIMLFEKYIVICFFVWVLFFYKNICVMLVLNRN